MTPVIEIATRLQSLGAIGAFILLLVKATVILLIARLLVVALVNASAAARHAALTAAIATVLILPLMMVLVPAWTVPLFPERSANAVRSIGTTGDDDEAPTALEAAITVARATGVVPQERLTAMSRFFETVKNSWQGLLVLMIGAVSLVLLFRMGFGIIGVSKVARRASRISDDEALRELDAACDHLKLNLDVRLLRSAEISVPVVWGIRRPMLLLPASSSSWTAERLRVVLLHELAHVKRWDGATLLVTRAAVAMFWFHPLMWVLERISRNECERACDDLVLESGARPSDYAEHLLSIARALPHTDPFRSVTLAMSRRSQLEGRLLSILQPRTRRGGFSMRTLSTYAAAALMIVVPLASVRLGASPQETKKQESKEREAVVEIGPAVAAKVIATPEMLLAGIEKLKKKRHSEPTDGSEWYGHAYELHRSDRHAEAIEAFKQSIAHGHRVAASKYNIACGYALMEDEQNAVAWLQDAIASGWDDYGHIAKDSDLDPIRSSPRFQQLVASLDGAARKQDRRIEETLDRFDALRTGNYDGGEWYSVGLDLLRLRRLDDSIVAFENAIRLDGKTSSSYYNLACALSLKGDTRAAAQYLERAVENGFDNVEKLKNDPDLRNVRSQVNIDQLVAMAEDLKLQTGWQGGGKWFFFGGEETAWKDMLPHYEAMTRKHPQLGRTWFNLGYAQLQAGQNDASSQSFQKALQLGYRPGASTYNTACAYARAGRNDLAFEWLQKARTIGFNLHDYLEDDDDLENLHDDPRWRQLRQQVRADEKKHEGDGEIF
jgi:beta-lactamase regulating signal transducer with metallopeptidase domain/Flp pilus assembly protein TadD